MRVVEGGGFRIRTDDPVVIAVVKRCAELEAALREARRQEVARFRVLRHDVRRIKRAVMRPAPAG